MNKIARRPSFCILHSAFCIASATLCAAEAPALTVAIDHPSPAAEQDFLYHLGKMGASSNVVLRVAEHPYKVVSDAEEAFRLKVEGGNAWISGHGETAVSHGIYALLERMGCDWVMPGEIGEVIPHEPNPRPADCDVEEAPSFRVRYPWCSGSARTKVRERKDFNIWAVRHKLHTDREHHPLIMHGGHVWQSIIKANKAEFDANPEMYALVRQPDGSFKRQGPQVETTNPRVIELFEKYIRDTFARNKWEHDKTVCLSVGPADGGGFSESPETKAISSMNVMPFSGTPDGTDALILLCNTLLKRLEGEFPNLHLGFYLYSWHGGFPTRHVPDPRIVIVVADIQFSRFHSTLEPVPTRIYERGIMEKWAKTPNVKFFRGYNWNLAENFLPYSKLKIWAEDYPFYHRMNVQGSYTECDMEWATLGPSNYLEAKLLWNVDADPEAVLDGYCRAAFGKGAPFMADYFRRLTRRQSEARQEAGSFHAFHLMYGKPFVEECLKLFDSAAAAAADDAEKTRIDHMRFPLEELGRFLDLRAMQFDFRFNEAASLLARMMAARKAVYDEPGAWVGAGATNMLKRFFLDTLNESARLTKAPYTLFSKVPDSMPTAFDPFDNGEKMGFADPKLDDSGWLRTYTYSRPWSAQGLSSMAIGSVWYRTWLPPAPEGPLGLLIGGCDSRAKVYVNGALVGEGRGFARPMPFDITDVVTPGTTNLLAIQVLRSGLSEIGVGGLLFPSFVFTGPRLERRAPIFDESIRLLPGGAIERVKP